MARTARLVIEIGADKGREIRVGENGARFGRSSKNDVPINDEKASRYHCRVYFKPDGRLCVADLGSANQTLVNKSPIQETVLGNGDGITIGDTVIRVVDDSSGPGPVDLGFGPAPTHPPRLLNRKLLLTIAAVVTLLAIAAWVPKLFRAIPSKPPPTQPVAEEARLLPMEVHYEKVLADEDRIFRYVLTITADNRITIAIDDTEKTHVREEGEVDDELIAELASFIHKSGFFELADDYHGLQPDVLDRWNIVVTLNKRAKRVRVTNRTEPSVFKAVRTRLEDFGQVELGLWAVQFPPEELLARAEQAFLLGRRLYDEREVQHGNLARAIKRFKEAEFYLRTIDPKPDYYPQVLSGISVCKTDLDDKYRDRNYAAERAIGLKDWEDAVEHLQVLTRIISDRSDPRYGEVRKKLLEVQRRLEAEDQ